MSERVYAATRKGLFTIDRKAGGGKTTWGVSRVAFLGDDASMVLPTQDDFVMVALGHGHFGVKLHRSSDAGATWQECAAPAYPPKPADDTPVDPVQQRPILWNLELMWALESGGADQPGVLWAGTIPGGLFKSGDRGSSREIVRSLWDNPKRKEWVGGGAEYQGIHSICVDPRNSQRVSLGVSCGGVWLTADGGKTWEPRAQGMRAAYMPPELAYEQNVQDPHRLVQCPGNPTSYWALHHNGIFCSTDDLKTWNEVTTGQPSTFGFAVAVHPKDPNTAWFVPAISDQQRYPVNGQVVVWRTRDGGKTFDVLRKGLPQEHAYDLTYRHGLDIDETGERLVFGTTTGSLFVSEDTGDSWQTVSTNLPPVYCARFAK